MAARARERATYQDLLRAPEDRIAELIDGELYTWPRPGGPHIVALSHLGMRLGPPFAFGEGGPGGWWILMEPEVHFGRNVTVPDLAGWRRERMPIPPEDQRFTITPDWICEISSPSTRRFDIHRKLPLYADHDVPYAWIVDPVVRTLQVFVLRDGHWSLETVHAGEEKVRAVPFEAVEIELASIWGPDSPPSP